MDGTLLISTPKWAKLETPDDLGKPMLALDDGNHEWVRTFLA